jgi:hypothetical protein
MTTHLWAKFLLSQPDQPLTPKAPSKRAQQPSECKDGPNPQNCPTQPFSKAICDLYNRGHDTPWSEKLMKAYRQIPKTVRTMENIGLIAAYYKAEWSKGDEGIWRRDIGTFLNNFEEELDRARAHHERSQRRLKRVDGQASKIVEMPRPENEDELRQAGVRAMQEARAAL